MVVTADAVYLLDVGDEFIESQRFRRNTRLDI